MPNWKKLITSGSDAALNSLNVTSELTASGIFYPTVDGTDGQALVTDGSGNLTFGFPTNADDAEKVTFAVQNDFTSTLQKGTPIHITSTTNGTSLVIPASASDASTMPAHGILNSQLAVGVDGEATIIGQITGVNTSAFTSGDTVYVGPSGGYTNVKPQGSGNLIQNLGVVKKVDASNGTGEIFGTGRSNDVPNLPVGKVWVGSSTYSVTSSVAHLDETNERLGINTNTPGASLDVIGDISGSTKITVGSGLTNSGTNTAVFGINNTTLGNYSLIAGGDNCITSFSNSSIAGGGLNVIGACCSFIGSGLANSITGGYSTISSGVFNKITAECSFIGAGSANTGSDQRTFIGAGQGNKAGGGYTAIVGGFRNEVINYGTQTTGFAEQSFIGSGISNCIAGGGYGTIVGGFDNFVSSSAGGFIGAGQNNTLAGGYFSNTFSLGNAIVAGCKNKICFPGHLYSFIGGGCCNIIACNNGVIGGGLQNCVTGGYSSVIGGGCLNTVSAAFSGILGGKQNTVSHECSFAIGRNLTSDKADYTFVNNIQAVTNISGSTLSLTGLANQASEATALMINGSNVVGTRELGTNAFNSTAFTTCTGTVTGTGANNRVATWNGTTSLDSSANFTYDGTTLDLTYTGTGDLLRLTSTDAGASSAPDLTFCRNSASPADNDTLGNVQFWGKSSAPANKLYAAIYGRIACATSGQTKGNISFKAECNNVFIDIANFSSNGLYVMPPDDFAITSPGIGLTVTGGVSGSTTLQIGSGHTNSGTLSSIAGGSTNSISSIGNCSLIGAGTLNTVEACYSLIGSGYNNCIRCDFASWSVIGGGRDNTIYSNGGLPPTLAYYSAILGGCGNQISDTGGSSNTACFSSVVGGQSNKVTSCHSSIVGGIQNTGSGACSFIGGGYSNNITLSCGCLAFIGGGLNNTICDTAAGGSVFTNDAIVGGSNNCITGCYAGSSTIGGGAFNHINNTFGGSNIIGGGSYNGINSAFAGTNIIAGGGYNCISIGTGGYASILGGRYNCINSAAHAVITGGTLNTGSGACSFIGGGASNTAAGTFSYAGGECSCAAGAQSFAHGYIAVAGGGAAGAFGALTQANGNNSFAIGSCTQATQTDSFAAGFDTRATGLQSTAFGYQTCANGNSSLAGGGVSCAIGENSFAWGTGNCACGTNSFALGCFNISNNNQSFVAGIFNHISIGAGTTNTIFGASNCITFGQNNFLIGGTGCVSAGSYNFIGGQCNKVINDIDTQGFATVFGCRNCANGRGSFSFTHGKFNNNFSFAGVALGQGSSAAREDQQFVFGCCVTNPNNGTTGNIANSMVIGRYNVWNITDCHLFAVGNGSSDGSRTNAFNVSSNGRVGVCCVSPQSALDVNGTTRTTALIETSARRYKENILSLQDQLDNLKKLEPVEFEWKETKKKDIGLIAEDVEKIYPHLVEHDDNGDLMGVKYSKLTSVLIKAVQEQQEQIDELRKEIFILKQQG